MSAATPEIPIPADLLPRDGRFGSGPSKVRTEAVEALAKAGAEYMGTSHRQATVRFVVGALRNGLAELLNLPDGYEIVLGNGGTTAFWDAAAFGLIERRSQHLSFGEFSSKFAAEVAAAPFLEAPSIIESPPGTHPLPVADADVDAYCLTHNETSTGVAMPLRRPDAASAEQLVLVDATSAAGGLRFDASQVDVYYFAPQKNLGSDGGLWLAAMSPRRDRTGRSASPRTDRWIPAFFDLPTAIDNSRKDQTYNTPALATLFLAVEQVEWINGNGGLEWAASRCDQSAGDPLRLGRRVELRDPVRHRPGAAQPRRRHDRPRRVGRRAHGVGRPASQRHRRHRLVPQARPQPAAHRDVHRRSTPTTSPPSRRCIDYVVERLT